MDEYLNFMQALRAITEQCFEFEHSVLLYGNAPMMEFAGISTRVRAVGAYMVAVVVFLFWFMFCLSAPYLDAGVILASAF